MSKSHEKTLSKQEAAHLERVMEAVNATGHEGQSFRSAIRTWAMFVRRVERGYSDSIYEYTNDLSIREKIAIVMGQLPPEIVEKVSSAVAQWDKRFLDATFTARKPLATRSAMSHQLWWTRIPRLLKGELAEDLKSEGYV